MVEWGTIIGLIIFFVVFFLAFTLIPRYILSFLDRLFRFDKTGAWLNDILVNYLSVLKTYFVFGLPIAGVLFYASMLGDKNVIIGVFGSATPFIALITALILLMTIRLSILLRKRELLRKIPILRGLDRFLPKLRSRTEIKEVYRSYLFDIFFTAFMSAMTIILFKVIFLRDQTIIMIPGYQKTITVTLNLLGHFFNQYVLWIFIVPLLTELLLLIFGVYKEFEYR